MATVKDLDHDVDDLKDWVHRLFDAFDALKKALAEALAKDVVDAAEVQAIHDKAVSVTAEISDKIHSGGM